ncbi:MAG TPA: hypothetical protein DEQ43_08100, partial [Nocardioides bacterium]|nr:hypothetical protein [Nocardioides sp.]
DEPVHEPVEADVEASADEAPKPKIDVSAVALAPLQQQFGDAASVATPPVEAPAVEAPAASWVEVAERTPAPTAPPAPAATAAYDSLDSRTPVPDSAEDGPIFAKLRSNWLSSDGDKGTWSTSEIEAGWEAAEQVAEAPTLQLSDSGLPMRRPGKRLVPGGVTPAVANAANVNRDPEAIRARLAAHAAG